MFGFVKKVVKWPWKKIIIASVAIYKIVKELVNPTPPSAP